MKCIYILSLSSLVSSLSICNTCKHFIPDELYDNIGRCSLYRHGREYELASIARLHPKKCNSTQWARIEIL